MPLPANPFPSSETSIPRLWENLAPFCKWDATRQPSSRPHIRTQHTQLSSSHHHYAQSILGSASTKNIHSLLVLAPNNMTKLSALTFLILCFDNVIIFWHFVNKRNVNLFISTRHTSLMFRNASRSVWHLLFNISSCWAEQPRFFPTAQCFFFADGNCVSRERRAFRHWFCHQVKSLCENCRSIQYHTAKWINECITWCHTICVFEE